MKTIQHIIYFGLLLLFSLTACEDSARESVNLSEEVDIKSFAINGTQGIINTDNQTITVMMPEGTNLASLAATVEIAAGATLSPASGTQIDFRSSNKSPVQYSVFNGNLYNTYKVTVRAIGDDVIYPLTIYNGENITPEWWTVGSAGDISSNFGNPKPNALNQTPYCASIWRNPGDDDWTGGGLGGLNIDPTVYNRFTLLVWKEYAGDVQLEIQGEGAGNQWLKVWYAGDALGEWQKLEFFLPEGHGLTKIHTILVAPQITGTKDDPNFFGQRMYWDELIAIPK
ncbi:hypothetical protein FACS189421_02510 [Bacteroidia bacterium]|nr:hypothetical protein FACS189421_02510 [Bacteroidia bacterium]GHT46879.1 hypothetical protein FACS189440_05890 [Bacteroidia bacterium]